MSAALMLRNTARFQGLLGDPHVVLKLVFDTTLRKLGCDIYQLIIYVCLSYRIASLML